MRQNICIRCKGPAPEGKELCWFCEHTPKLHQDGKAEEDPDALERFLHPDRFEQECEACRIPAAGPEASVNTEGDNGEG